MQNNAITSVLRSKFREYKVQNIDLIKNYEQNSRTHSEEQVQEVIRSINEYGYTNPILVDETNTIIAGHCRITAAKRIGLDEIPTIIIDGLTPVQKAALVIADNKLALNAGWDFTKLAEQITFLKDNDYDTDLTGFKADEIATFMPDVLPEFEGDEDDVPETPAEPITKLGDVYLLGGHRLMCGDSTIIGDVERLMNGEKADMVFTDPPYGVDYKGIENDGREGLEDLLHQSLSNMSLSCKEGSSVYIFHSDKCADIFHKVFREFCHFSSMLIWVKKSLVMSRGDYHSRHEPCMYGWFNNGTHKWYGTRSQDSLLEFDREKIDGHTTPKPILLIENILINSSLDSSIVVDLFGGSGSTLIACEKTGRKCFMMELSPLYCDVIVARWMKFTGKKATLEASDDALSDS